MKIVVPDVCGLTFSEAAFRLLCVGLRTTITRIEPVRSSAGIVAEQHPAAGERLRTGRAVDLHLLFPEPVPALVAPSIPHPTADVPAAVAVTEPARLATDA